jgi:hypothetical protein
LIESWVEAGGRGRDVFQQVQRESSVPLLPDVPNLLILHRTDLLPELIKNDAVFTPLALNFFSNLDKVLPMSEKGLLEGQDLLSRPFLLLRVLVLSEEGGEGGLTVHEQNYSRLENARTNIHIMFFSRHNSIGAL